MKMKNFVANVDGFDLNDPAQRLRFGAEIVAWAVDTKLNEDEERLVNVDNVPISAGELIRLAESVTRQQRIDEELEADITSLAHDLYASSYPADHAGFKTLPREMKIEFRRRAEGLIDKGWHR